MALFTSDPETPVDSYHVVPDRRDHSEGMALLQVLQFVPVVGTLAAGGYSWRGLGAVVIAYYILAPFEPPTLPG